MKKLLGLLLLVVTTLASATTLNNIIVFGDSLSDNGNLYEQMKGQLPLSPPYYAGRFSNGPVWVELLANHYYPSNANKHLLNYAFGGAAVSEKEKPADYNLHGQVNKYLSDHTADPNSLYVIWIGANNYLGVPSNYEKTVTAVQQGIHNNMVKLINSGAQHFFILDLPDLGSTPVAREFETTAELTKYSLMHNKAINEELTTLQKTYPKVEFLHLSTYDLFQKIITHPLQYGFSNISDSCYQEDAPQSSKNVVLNLAASVKPKNRSFNDECEGYLFFDPIHPTHHTHEVMTQFVIELFDKSGLYFS